MVVLYFSSNFDVVVQGGEPGLPIAQAFISLFLIIDPQEFFIYSLYILIL